MRREVITINREEASRACAIAISEFIDKLKSSDDDAEFRTEVYAMKMMEFTVFSAMVVSILFEDLKLKREGKNE